MNSPFAIPETANGFSFGGTKEDIPFVVAPFKGLNVGGAFGSGAERTQAQGIVPINAIASAFTVEAWVNPSSLPVDQCIASQQFFPGQLKWFLFAQPSGLIGFRYSITGAANIFSSSIGAAVVVGEWHHVAVTFENPGSVSIYFDGLLVMVPVATTGPMFNSSADLVAGADDNLSVAWTDKIAQLRIWNVARSAAEILANFNKMLNSAPGLVASYPFDDGRDKSGNSLDITLLGSAFYELIPKLF